MTLFDAESTLREHMQELFQVLALGLTLEEDRQVQESFRPADQARFCIRLDDRNCWVEVGLGEPAQLHRSRPARLKEVVLPQANGRSAEVAHMLLSGLLRVNADRKAAEILSPLISPNSMPLQRTLGPIMRWAPIFEMAAYGAATSIGALLDQDRSVLFTPTPGMAPLELRRRYWSRLTLAARLTLVSTPLAAREWLSRMANSFEWVSWTPSWMLLRERSLWLAAIAARAAAAFGPDLVDNYLEMLNSESTPMKVLDALFGLTSIAIASPVDRRSILVGTQKAISALADRGALALPTLQFATRQAINTMENPDATRRRSRLVLRQIGLRKNYFVPVIIARDAAQPTAAQEVPAFSILPLALNASPADFFPATSRVRPDYHLGLTDADLASLLLASWSPEPGPIRTLH